VSAGVDEANLSSNDNLLESWLLQQDWSISGSAFGPGVGEFLGLGADDGEMGILNESW